MKGEYLTPEEASDSLKFVKRCGNDSASDEFSQLGLFQLNALAYFFAKKVPKHRKGKQQDGKISKITIMSIGLLYCQGKPEEFIQTLFDIASFRSQDSENEPI